MREALYRLDRDDFDVVRRSDGTVTLSRPGAGFLAQLTLDARMVRTGGSCGGTNTFTVGPRVLNVLRG